MPGLEFRPAIFLEPRIPKHIMDGFIDDKADFSAQFVTATVSRVILSKMIDIHKTHGKIFPLGSYLGDNPVALAFCGQ